MGCGTGQPWKKPTRGPADIVNHPLFQAGLFASVRDVTGSLNLIKRQKFPSWSPTSIASGPQGKTHVRYREKFLTTQGAHWRKAPSSHPALYMLCTRREKLLAHGELCVPSGGQSLVMKPDAVFTIISGVGTIAILFLFQTSLQLCGYTASRPGG